MTKKITHPSRQWKTILQKNTAYLFLYQGSLSCASTFFCRNLDHIISMAINIFEMPKPGRARTNMYVILPHSLVGTHVKVFQNHFLFNRVVHPVFLRLIIFLLGCRPIQFSSNIFLINLFVYVGVFFSLPLWNFLPLQPHSSLPSLFPLETPFFHLSFGSTVEVTNTLIKTNNISRMSA